MNYRLRMHWYLLPTLTAWALLGYSPHCFRCCPKNSTYIYIWWTCPASKQLWYWIYYIISTLLDCTLEVSHWEAQVLNYVIASKTKWETQDALVPHTNLTRSSATRVLSSLLHRQSRKQHLYSGVLFAYRTSQADLSCKQTNLIFNMSHNLHLLKPYAGDKPLENPLKNSHKLAFNAKHACSPMSSQPWSKQSLKHGKQITFL